MADEQRATDTRVGPQRRSSISRSRVTRRLLTMVTASGLAVDSWVHWHLAPSFDTLTSTASPHISQGQLFRLEAALALIAMVLLLVTQRRFAAVVAFLVAAGGVGAVLLYAFVDVGALGPMPDMYDPIWSALKTTSAVAEAVAAAGALALIVLPPDSSRHT